MNFLRFVLSYLSLPNGQAVIGSRYAVDSNRDMGSKALTRSEDLGTT
jgi:hypothetical protein